MSLSTQMVAGLSSGFDWRTMIDQLIEIERGRVDLVEDKKADYEAQLAEWQSFNTQLLSLKTAAGDLKDPSDFYVYTSNMTSSSTVTASSLLSVSTTTTAGPGTYSIQIDELAQAQKLSSKGFSSYNDALGLSGEFVINGRAVVINATDDLMAVRDVINNLNNGDSATGVTASILSVASGDHRLVLTSDATGKAGIDLKDATAETTNLVQALGFTYSSSGTAKTVKHVTGISSQRSDYFSSRTSAVGSLLGLSSAQSSATITIGDKSNISINLATASLDDIKTAIDTAAPTGVTASVVETTIDDETKYYLKIEGTTTFGDKNNILETLGILKSDFETVSTEIVTADRVNTTDGSTAITAGTAWADLYGAGISVSDTIAISGTDHSGRTVSGTLTIDNTSHTVQELLTAIQNTFGDVTASIVDGKIRITDNVSGDSQLSVTLTENNQGGGALDLGSLAATTLGVGNERNTTDGVTAISAATTWAGLYGASVAVSDTITISGTDHNGNDVSGTVTIDDTGHTVQELLTAIEAAFSSTVTASINADGKIQVVDDDSGASYLSLTLTEGNEGGGSLDFGVIEMSRGGTDRQIVQGSDASLLVDNVRITSSDNTVEDVIAGVTLNLLKADANTTITLDVDRDLDAVMAKVTAFVEAYNEVATYIAEQQAYDEEEEEGGVLFSDGTLYSVKSDLTATLLETVWGVSSDFSALGLIGINLDKEGQLSVDTDKLQGYLQTNFADVKQLFVATGTADVGTLSHSYHTTDTQAGEYAVNITNAATRNTTTSDRVVGPTLGYDETLTIVEGDKTAEITLTSGMSLSQIASVVNSELEAEYTETLVGSNALTVTGGGSPITSATTWDNINGVTLYDEDEISFSGTTRSGASVSGVYTITDVTTDTVQGLLSEISDSFSSDVVASIDGSGRVVLTDKYVGASQLTLTISAPGGSGLDFGTVDVTVGAGDGSQEGRYALTITAGVDGEADQLVLTSDGYGDDYTFTISENTDTGLWTGSQTTPLTVDNGEDVAGTIGGESATGSGQNLTGASGDVEGLVVQYSGTAEGLSVGNVTLTLGVAELFDRVLFSITDAYDGYVGFKQDSIEASIDRLESEIEQMEERLDRKMQLMITKFVYMEQALSTLQNQSQWLAGQINAIYGS